MLISILSAWHEGVFTLDEVQSTLEMLFEKQYILTVSDTHRDVYKRQIITFVMCYERIQLVIEKNNLHDLDTWIFFKWIFKTRCV